MCFGVLLGFEHIIYYIAAAVIYYVYTIYYILHARCSQRESKLKIKIFFILKIIIIIHLFLSDNESFLSYNIIRFPRSDLKIQKASELN